VDELARSESAKYVAGLGSAATKAGAEIHEKTRVIGLERNSSNGNSGWKVKTSRGELQARDVFDRDQRLYQRNYAVAAKETDPIGSFIIVTKCCPRQLQKELSPRNRMIYGFEEFPILLRLTPDRRNAVRRTCRVFPENENTVRESARILREGMIEVYPQLRGTRAEFVWGGTLDFAFDIIAARGKNGRHVFFSGICRTWRGHGHAVGKEVAETILTGHDENPFAGIPFPARRWECTTAKPWFCRSLGLGTSFWIG